MSPAPVSVDARLLAREVVGPACPPSKAVRSIYGSRRWVTDLDIVGELYGHRGCVNALSWNRDGTRLATGSDDHRINIYNADAGFTLNTRIETGHTNNIFSAKFMPHSADRTIVSAAGDEEVRVFDIEYAPSVFSSTVGAPRAPQAPPPPPPSNRRFRPAPAWASRDPMPSKIHAIPKRVYTKHTEMVKRVVTESSPFLFLTCSEDGTVRQFDLRQPSQFYARRRNQNTQAGQSVLDVDDDCPPLISYREHHIDLHSLSCSTTQPHYLALGGSHLHCFLHDRRMLGRNLAKEAGKTIRPASSSSDDVQLTAATQCVRRFQPRRNPDWDRTMQNSHITGCKISDANPNEVLVSWSGDGVYLFDIHRSPQPDEPGEGREHWIPNERSRRLKRDRAGKAPMRKRRRDTDASSSSGDAIVPGQSMVKMAGLVINIRKELFGLFSSNMLKAPEELPAERKKSYDAALALAHVTLKRANRAVLELEDDDVAFFNSCTRESVAVSASIRRERINRRTLARNRRRTRAFVKAAGCLSRALGGWVDGIGLGAGVFADVGSGLNESSGVRFRFLDAVVAFLDGGAEAVRQLANEIQAEEEMDDVDTDDPDGALHRLLVEMERLAVDTAVRDVDTLDEVFGSEKDMIRAFRSVVELGISPNTPATTKRFWGDKVGRAVLMKEAEGVDFAFVDRAFRGASEELHDDDETASDGDGDVNLMARNLLGTIDDAVAEDDDGSESEDEGEDEDMGSDDNMENSEDSTDEDGDGQDLTSLAYRRRHRRAPIEGHAPIWEHTKVYRGHCNIRTIKDVNFYGLEDEYVVSGSDCGHLFIWDKKTTQIVQILRADEDTVNVAVGHPYEPLLAVSGIDYTIKLFSPDQRLQSEFSEFGAVPADENRPCSAAAAAAAATAAATGGDEPMREASEEQERWTYSGRASRRRLHSKDEITSQNSVMNESGASRHVITRSMLNMVMARMQASVEGGTLTLAGDEAENCPIM